MILLPTLLEKIIKHALKKQVSTEVTLTEVNLHLFSVKTSQSLHKLMHLPMLFYTDTGKKK